MGTITTSVGLISGINSADIIDQLMALEERPKTLIQQRNAVLQAQQTAFTEISAKLLSLKLPANSLSNATAFNKRKAFSSNESVLTATAKTGATPGNYVFRIAQLVGSQQSISKGFLDSDATPLSSTGGVLTFERGGARLDAKTNLSALNGGSGVTRGYIRITDRSGATTTVDLSAAVTVDDVIDKINQASSVNVLASVDGDQLVIEDASGGAGTLSISNVGTSGTATSLGIAGSDLDADGIITGTQINRIGRDTLLNTLNDGNGVSVSSLPDFRITAADGTTYDIDLDGAVTLGDVIDTIEETTAGAVTVGITSDGVGLQLTDTTTGGSTLTVAALNSSTAAADLGILGTDGDADGDIEGSRLVAAINSKLLKGLNGGNGLAAFGGSTDAFLQGSTNLADLLGGAGLTTSGDASADLEIYARDGSSTAYSVDLDALTTVQDLIDAVDTATAGKIKVTLSGDKLRFTDATTGTGNLTIQSVNGSTAAAELGIEVDAAISTFLSADLDPAGAAAAGGTITITNSAGGGGSIDLTSAQSVSDIIDLINDAGLGVTASLNQAGNGITLTDTAGGTGSLTIADSSGVLAQQLGIAGTFASGKAEGANLQFQYITEATRLDSLGVTAGKFRISDSTGASAVVDLTQGNEVTLGDVISEINSRGLQINARINDTGDGILIEDTGGGSQAIEITEEGSTTAKDLGLLGVAPFAGADLDGSFEKVIAITSDDTLADLALKITNAKVGVAAGVINDGSQGAPYRLSLTSSDPGSTNAFVFDDGGLGLGVTTLAEAQDAVVFYGSSDPAKALAITSTSNRLENIIPGVTIDLLATSDQPVQVTVNEDVDAVVTSVQNLITAFNGVVDTLNKYDSYNAETEERGLLLGDSTVLRVRSAIYNAVIGANTELSGQFTSLAQVGIKIGTGARLQFDETKFREALATDADAVKDLFTFEQFEIDEETGEETETVIAQGVMKEIDKLLERLTDADGGVVTDAVDVIERQVELNNDRIESIEKLLEAKRARLENQFVQMELALAKLQDQSSSLTQLANLAAAAKSSG